MYRYLLTTTLLLVSGCQTGKLLSDKQLSFLTPTARTAITQKQVARLNPAHSSSESRWVKVEVISAKLLSNKSIKPAKGQKISVQAGKCGTIVISNNSDASALQVCNDGYQLRFGTGSQELVLHEQAAWANGMVINQFLTEEHEGIYSLTMRINQI